MYRKWQKPLQMIRYTSNNQLKLELFESPFERGLDPKNRWVELARLLPWDALASIYYRQMSAGQGAPGKDARIVIGAVILKHKMKLSDREVIEQIKENCYLQYFLGLERFTNDPVFDPSLFPTIRRRLGVAQFEAMNEEILLKAGIIEPPNSSEEPDSPGNSDSGISGSASEAELENKSRKGRPSPGKGS